MIRKTLTELKNDIMMSLIQDKGLVRSLVIPQENFLNETLQLSDDIKEMLNNPRLLIRSHIYPYKKNLLIETENKTIISMAFTNFRPTNGNYRNGEVTFFILCPYSYEKTNYGIRYDWIADEIESIFEKNGIGEFEFVERGDLNINDTFLGHYVSFEIIDFYMES